MYSLWSETSNLPSFKPLNKNLKTDVLIIGGGITGILTAYYLQQAGVNYVLVEADSICSGITKNTTAKITSQHGFIYHKIEKKYGIDAAGLYLEANEKALWEYKKLSKEILCDFVEETNYVYTLTRPDKHLKETAFSSRICREPSSSLPHRRSRCFSESGKVPPVKASGRVSKASAHLRAYQSSGACWYPCCYQPR